MSTPSSTNPPATSVDQPSALVESRARTLRRFTSSSVTYMSVVLLALIAVFGALNPNAFLGVDNLRNLVIDTAIVLTMAVAMTYVMVAAGFDLSIGSILVFSGICAVKVMDSLGGQGYLTVFVGLLAALVGGVLWGLFNGFCITRLRVPALITTLGTMGAALGVANLVTNGNDIAIGTPAMITLQTQYVLGMPWIVWIALAVTLVGALFLTYTKFGRHTYIVGSNAEAARRAGINVDRHMVTLYAISGLVAGLAGMMSLIRFSTTTIGGHGLDSLTVITGVILGGTSLYGGSGTVIGTTIGIFIPTVLQNGLVVQRVQPFWQNVVIGFILIAAVFLDQVKRRSRDRT